MDMKKELQYYQQHKNIIWTILGILAVSMIVLPYLLLGKGSYVQIHDQMDGEILNYIYRAKYLFRGDVIPEFMNGMSKASMMPPAPLGVFFYAVLPPFAAYVVMQYFVVLVGFLGMRGLCRHMGVREELASLVAILFSFFPFYPVYGLSALGQPLLILCYLRLLKGEKKFLPLLGIMLYAGFSSLTLVGYVWIALAMAVTLWLLVRKEKNMAGRSFLAFACMLFVYLAANLELLCSLFGGGFATHRQEMVLHPAVNLTGKFLELLFQGAAYHPVYSPAIFVLCIAFLLGMLCRKLFLQINAAKEEIPSDASATERQADGGGASEMLRRMVLLLGLILLGTVLAVLWNSGAVVKLRAAIGGIAAYFQADRISWTFPMLWMLLFAGVLEAAGRCLKTRIKLVRAGVFLVCAGVFLLEGALVFKDSTLNKNIRLLLLDDYEQVTWEGFYMEDVFDRIDDVLGEDKNNVSVVSLGLYPSIALYNGYTCADGYSNNYELAYKHAFREIMAEELEKEEANRVYFDEWGNRLYLISAEYGFNAMIGKNTGAQFAAPDYDVDAMRDLNIGYVFAAASIQNADELGLEQVGGGPFSSPSSYYEVWVYRVE